MTWAPSRVGGRQSPQCGLGDLDVISGGVRPGVAFPEEHRDGFAGATGAVVNPRSDRVVTETTLESRCCQSFSLCAVIRVASRSMISGSLAVA